jgi:hypothetical protein
MHGLHDSATTLRVAGHGIKSHEAARDSAAARAQTVWARPQTSLPTSRTRLRRNRLHISQANCPCRKRRGGRGTTGDQQLAALGLCLPQDVRARLLHRLVRSGHQETAFNLQKPLPQATIDRLAPARSSESRPAVPYNCVPSSTTEL